MTTTKATGAVTAARTLINENTHSDDDDDDDHDHDHDDDDDKMARGSTPKSH